MTAQPETVALTLLPDARHGMASAWFRPVPGSDGRRRVAESPLDQAGHVGSTVVQENDAWLAAMNRQWSPMEAWLRKDAADRRAHDEALAARIEQTVAALPQEQPPGAEPGTVRRTGRFGRRVPVPEPAPVLEGSAETAMQHYESDAHEAHAEYPDADDKPKRSGRHGTRRGFRLGRRSR